MLQENRGLGLYNYLICKTFSYSAKEFSEAASFKVFLNYQTLNIKQDLEIKLI